MRVEEARGCDDEILSQDSNKNKAKKKLGGISD